ncbi:MAG: SpoIIIAH-like family protein [Clostridia bacterium]|nr:SpoIIIAH-like family protein [Clostridia bacterium]MBQ8793037.1 SpoIIIAH-like family protein [Clostridia bacterium]
MKKRTKIIIITAMVLLLGVTGYLNVMLNNSVSNSTVETTTSASYFSTYRSTRESTRDQELLYYDAIIANESSSADAIKSAETLKLNLISQMEQELVIEGLIKAKGFEDCIVSILDENVNAVVKAKELSSTEVAQILAVIQSQLSVSLENVKIIPVE